MEGNICYGWRGLTNQGVHHLDLLRLFLGTKNVFGRARTFGLEIEVEDTFIGLCEFSDTKIGSIEVTTAARMTFVLKFL